MAAIALAFALQTAALAYLAEFGEDDCGEWSLRWKIAIHRNEKATCAAITTDRFGSRLCENGQEPTRRRIVFSIALFSIAAIALFFSRLPKSRRTFYA